MLLVILMVNVLRVRLWILNNLQKKKKKKKKIAKKKRNKLYVKWKGYNNYINSWINKKDIIQNADLKQSKFELDLSNYARKSNFKSATGVDTLKFAK